MSQQINLYVEIKKSGKDFSALNMAQGLGLIIFCAILFYAYSAYQARQLEQQTTEVNKSIAAEQTRQAGLKADFMRQRSGLTVEQELKKIEAEAYAQREIINALKSGVIGNTKGYSLYMQAFARQTIGGLWLTGFSIDGDATQMSIYGAVLSPELVPVYIMRLNNEAVMRGKTFASLEMQLPKTEAHKPETGKAETGKLTTPQYLEFVLQSVATGEAEK